MSRSDAPEMEILQQAAEWFALLQSNAATEDERHRWQAWVEASPQHRNAWLRVETISRHFAVPETTRSAVGEALEISRRRLLDRRRSIKALLGIAGASVMGWGLSRTDVARQVTAMAFADHSTAVGETRELRMDEGSLVWMNTDTAVGVEYDSDIRRLRLLRGEVLIETAADTTYPPRPFVVQTAQARLRALGTRFSVRRLTGDEAELAVYEGRVEVRPSALGDTPQIIDAGQQVRLREDSFAVPEQANLAREAWTRGVLLADNVPLREFLTELSRYRHGVLTCDSAVADLTVVGGYPLDDPDRALALLEAALPIRIHQRVSWWVNVGPR